MRGSWKKGKKRSVSFTGYGRVWNFYCLYVCGGLKSAPACFLLLLLCFLWCPSMIPDLGANGPRLQVFIHYLHNLIWFWSKSRPPSRFRHWYDNVNITGSFSFLVPLSVFYCSSTTSDFGLKNIPSFRKDGASGRVVKRKINSVWL